MTNNFLVFNITRGFSVKRKHALKAIGNCAAVWVEENVTIRDLNLAESIEARNKQAKLQEPLPYAEVHGLRFDPPVSGLEANRLANRLVWEAHDFLRSVA